MKYNPFAYIRSEKDILKLVNTLIANTKGEGEKSGEDFWVKAERLSVLRPDRLYLVRGARRGKELHHSVGNDQRIGSQRGRRGIIKSPVDLTL